MIALRPRAKWAWVRRSWAATCSDPSGETGPTTAWQGWWGEDPPYHHDTFVLTHHPRESVTMEGGTVFHFVTDGIEAALERAVAAADGQDVRLAGGVSAIQQYLRAGLVDEMHLAYAPALLGSGERLFDNLADAPQGYEIAEFVGTPAALHVRFVAEVLMSPENATLTGRTTAKTAPGPA